jgi:hypothetical protein
MAHTDDPGRRVGEPPDAPGRDAAQMGSAGDDRDESVTDKLKEGVEKVKDAISPEKDDDPGRVRP